MRSLSIAFVALTTLLGCGGASTSTRGTTAARATRVAVLPSTWITDPVVPPAETDAVLARALGSSGALEIVRHAGARPPDGCDQDPACVRAFGTEARAESVAHARLAGLGATVVVRARLVDVEGRAREQSQEEVVRNATEARVREAVARLGRALAPSPPDDGEAWYEAWWLWTAAGVVALGAAATVIVLAATGNDRNPDFVITPP